LSEWIVVDGLRVEVVKKDIKHLYVGVYPPEGRVRVAAPARMGDEPIRMAVLSRLPWIRRQRRQYVEQERQGRREYASRESHYYLGDRYLLDLVYREGPSRVRIRGSRTIELAVPPGSDRDFRERRMLEWYRGELRTIVAESIPRRAGKVGLDAPLWGIKRMRTRWGTCQPEEGRIWINSELIKKPRECIEFVIAHELVHLIEKNHTDRFTALMAKAFPRWRASRSLLNAAPLAYEDWEY
jgi:predicted metal-dependent hydrolase